jgi:hypothetical protein
VKALALGLALLVAPLAGCASHAGTAQGCRALPTPQGENVDYTGSQHGGVWLVNHQVYGYSPTEDSTVSTCR